jgi:FtsH-binding integral membrane protein
MAIGVVYAILFYTGSKVPGTMGTPFEEPVVTGQMLKLSAIYFVIAAIAALVFPLIFVITHPGKAKYALIGVLIFAIVLVLGYLLGSSTPVETATAAPISAQGLKLVDAGLKTAIILLALAFLGIFYSEISSIFR